MDFGHVFFYFVCNLYWKMQNFEKGAVELQNTIELNIWVEISTPLCIMIFPHLYKLKSPGTFKKMYVDIVRLWLICQENKRCGLMLEVPQYFPTCQQQWTIHEVRKIYSKSLQSNKVDLSTVPVDGLAPVGARPSAGTVMIKFRSHIYTGSALEMLKKCT